MFGLMSAPSEESKAEAKRKKMRQRRQKELVRRQQQEEELGRRWREEALEATKGGSTTALMLACMHNLEHDVREIIVKKVPTAAVRSWTVYSCIYFTLSVLVTRHCHACN